MTGCKTVAVDPVQTDALSRRIKRTGIDWQNMRAKTNTTYQAIQSWIPESGIRGRYQIAKSVLSKQTVESLVGEPAFVKGPHGTEMDYSSNKVFGYYNPHFLSKLQQMLRGIFNNQSLVTALQPVYDSELKNYLRVYYISYEIAANNKEVITDYKKMIKSASASEGGFLEAPSQFLQESFRDFAESVEKDGYDVYEGFTCPGFWVRRSIDGTEAQFYKLLKLTLNTFDQGFISAYN